MRASLLAIHLLLFVTADWSRAATAAKTASPAPLDAQTPAEQAVAAQLSSGKEIDLTKLPEGQRTVRAAFLKSILATPFSQVPNGSITIIGAEIPDTFSVAVAAAIDVPLNIKLERCHFANAVECAGCHFHGTLSLQRCRFDDGLHLPNNQIDGDLLLGQNVTKAKGKGERAILINGSHIGGQFTLQPRAAGEAIAAASVTASKVDVNVTNAGKIRLLNFANLSANRLSIFNGRPGSSPVKTLFLNAANVKENLVIEGLTVNDLTAQQLTVGFRTTFSDVTVTNKLTLSAAVLDSFEFALPAAQNGEPLWPKEIVLDDFSFKSGAVTIAVPNTTERKAQASEGPAGRQDVTLEFIEKANYSQSAYTSYESQLDREGRSHDAEDVFTEMHRARRRSDFKAANPATWLTTIFDYFQEYFLGYGRSVVPPLVWSIVFIALGTYLFRRRELMQADDDKAPRYSSFWYSLEMFLPIVDLGMGKSWRPRDSSFLVTYARVHQIAGWVLIPVALAAITGAVK